MELKKKKFNIDSVSKSLSQNQIIEANNIGCKWADYPIEQQVEMVKTLIKKLEDIRVARVKHLQEQIDQNSKSFNPIDLKELNPKDFIRG